MARAAPNRSSAAARERGTGSVHIVGFSDPASARAFAFDEPNYQAGVYRDVVLRRWHNVLGRTMWDFPGGDTWLGTAALVRSPDPASAGAVLTQERYAGIEIHSWQFGGRS